MLYEVITGLFVDQEREGKGRGSVALTEDETGTGRLHFGSHGVGAPKVHGIRQVYVVKKRFPKASVPAFADAGMGAIQFKKA